MARGKNGDDRGPVAPPAFGENLVLDLSKKRRLSSSNENTTDKASKSAKVASYHLVSAEKEEPKSPPAYTKVSSAEEGPQHDFDLEDKLRDRLSDFLSRDEQPAFGATAAHPAPASDVPFSEIHARDQENAALKARCNAMQAELKAKDDVIKTKDDAYDNLYKNFRTLRIQLGNTEIQAERYKKALNKALAEIDSQKTITSEMVVSNAKAFFDVNEEKAGMRLELVRYEGYLKEAGEEIDDLKDERTSSYNAHAEVEVLEAEIRDLKGPNTALSNAVDKVQELERKFCALEDQKNAEIDELKAQMMILTEKDETEKTKYEKYINAFNRLVFDLHWKYKKATGQAEELAECDSDADAMDVDGEGEGYGDGTMSI